MTHHNFKIQYDLILKTLLKEGIDTEYLIKNNIALQNFQRRQENYPFNLNEHIKGLVYSLLSNQRPWKKIAENLDYINEVFKNFDASELKKIENPDYFVISLKDKGLGNRAIKKQMQRLKDNITLFESIEIKFGSIDNFIQRTGKGSNLVHFDIENVALEFSKPGPNKLDNIGFALAMEYLRNLGYTGAKPDVHINRICSEERLGLFDNKSSDVKKHQRLMEITTALNLNLTEVDYVLWLFAAKGYGDICQKEPQCSKCLLAEHKVCNRSL
jgi:endonuclease III